MSYLLLVTIILVISMEPNIPMLVLVTDTFYFVTGTISLMLVIVTGRAQKIIFRPGYITDNYCDVRAYENQPKAYYY